MAPGGIMNRPGERLVDGYDLVILDLDGVVFLIDRPIPGAPEAINRLRGEGKPLTYVTNNASRGAAEVADILSTMGTAARPHEVLTSAAAAASLLTERLPSGATVLVVGAPALRAEIGAVGLVPVSAADDAPRAVVQGYGPHVCWADLAEAAVAVRAGALWVATNTDLTLPSPRGALPGNGALVAALRATLGRPPDVVVGKPEPELFHVAASRAHARRALVIGDRLDTDIEGAVRAGLDSLLVLTGVSRPADLLTAPASRRPTYVAYDLGGLFDVDGVVRLAGDGGGSGDAEHWRVTADGSDGHLSGTGSALGALRALCEAAWSGRPVERISADSDAAGAALRALGLDGR